MIAFQSTWLFFYLTEKNTVCTEEWKDNQGKRRKSRHYWTQRCVGSEKKHSSIAGENRILGIETGCELGISLFCLSFLLPLSLGIFGLLEMFTLDCHSRWCSLSQTSAEIRARNASWDTPLTDAPQTKTHSNTTTDQSTCGRRDTSASVRCLVNTQSTKGDIRVVFDKLMWGEKLFTKQIPCRFHSTSCDTNKLVISCVVSAGKMCEWQCYGKK